MTDKEPFTEEAKYFVETRLLQQDVQIILESAANQNLIGTIVHPVTILHNSSSCYQAEIQKIMISNFLERQHF